MDDVSVAYENFVLIHSDKLTEHLTESTENSTVEYESQNLDESRIWSWWLLQVGTPLVVIVGLTGNALSLLVLKSRQFRGKSYSHYLCALAVFDSLVLVCKYARRLNGLLTATGHGGLFHSYGDAGCKIHEFVEHVCYLMSRWMKTPGNDTCVRDGHLCTAPERYRHVYVILHIYLYQIVLQFALPAMLILAANMAILRRIRALRHGFTLDQHTAPDGGPLYRGVAGIVQQDAVNFQTEPLAAANSSPPGCIPGPPPPTTVSMAFRRHTTAAVRGLGTTVASSLSNGGGIPRSGYRVTGMMLIVSFSYVGCLLPLVVLSLVVHVAVLTNPDVAERLFVALDDCQGVFELISELNYAANFYIYVLSGAQFRHALRRVVCRCRCGRGLRGGRTARREAVVVGGRYGDDVRPVITQRKKPLAFNGSGGGSGNGSGGPDHHHHSDQQPQRSRQSPRQNANVFHFRQFDLENIAANHRK